MQSLSPRLRAPLDRSGSLSLSVCGFWLLVGGAATCASSAVWATSGPQRFQLVGSGILNLDQSVQKSESVRLKASVTPTDAASEASLLVQVGGRFAVTASLAASPMVCYNDTIFRDDFDGDGF